MVPVDWLVELQPTLMKSRAIVQIVVKNCVKRDICPLLFLLIVPNSKGIFDNHLSSCYHSRIKMHFILVGRYFLQPLIFTLSVVWQFFFSISLFAQIGDHILQDHGSLRTSRMDLEMSRGVQSFVFHFKEKDIGFVQKCIAVLEADARDIADYFHYNPKDDIHIFIRDDKTLPNGSAQTFPRNVITLLTHPPTGSHYLVNRDDWIRALLIHELVHIIHMDTTNGAPDVVRKVFGSLGKFGGIVPVWFAEGLATWAETKFTLGGRGRRRLLRYETDRLLLDGNFCRSIDCLDDPGIYPRGSAPYWVGWRFLSFLEDRREGALRCLVLSNSRKIPFFLNWAFKECTGKSAADNFGDFLSSVEGRHGGRRWEPPSSFEPIVLPDQGEGIRFQQGMAFYDDRLYYVDDDEGRSFINELALGPKRHRRFRVEENVYALLDAGREGLSFSVIRHSPSVDRRHLRYLRGGEVLPSRFEGWFDYIFQIDGEEYYFAYEKNRWHLYRRGGDGPLNVLDEFEDIQSPFVFQGKIRFKSISLADAPPRHRLKEIDPKTGTTALLASLPKPFGINGRCGGFVFMADDDGGYVYGEGGISKIGEDKPTIVSVHGSDGSSLWLFQEDPLQAYVSRNECGQVAALLSDEAPSPPQPSGAPEAVGDKPISLDDYNGLKYLVPKYWFYLFRGEGRDAGVDIQTSLSDPLELHNMDVRLTRFSTLNKWAGKIDYQKQWESLRTSLSYEKDFIFSRAGEGGMVENYSASVSKPWWWGGWYFSSGIGVGQRNGEGGLSRTGFSETFLPVRLGYSSFLVDGFVRSFVAEADVFELKPPADEGFYGGQGKFMVSFQPLFGGYADIGGSYGRLDKDSLSPSSGLIYAGGSGYHGMYSLAKDRARGNTVSTARVAVRWDGVDVFRGWGLFPAHLGRIAFFGGVEHLGADRIVVADTLPVLRHVRGVFGGVGLGTTLAYRAAFELELVYAEADVPGNLGGRWSVLVRSSLP